MMGEIHLEGEVLERFLDDQLSRDEKAAIREHIGGSNCKRCEDALAKVGAKKFRRAVVRLLRTARLSGAGGRLLNLGGDNR